MRVHVPQARDQKFTVSVDDLAPGGIFTVREGPTAEIRPSLMTTVDSG
jgi:hypothetical protein